MKIKVVIFDLDGTLYESEEYTRQLMEGIRDSLAEFLSMDTREAEKLLRRLRAEYGSITLGLKSLGIDKSEFYRVLVDKLTPEKFIKTRPKLLELLSTLRRRGLRLVCHTNASRVLAEKVLKALEIPSNTFDVVMTCDDAEPKPMYDGYLKIIEILGVRPEDALYVGDRWKVELEPAKKLGMKTALISSKLDGEPDLLLRDVLELSEKMDFFEDP
ncbi:MAG: HAD-IA family hydrolase [Nitrososphaeria archaeon]|nr:HAD-IA family hydrolase [Nitrososphaeria archaeon]